MPFHVSCPTCESRLKLPDRLYQTRVRGRLAALHCTRCKKEFQIDGRGKPQGDKLPSVPPAADSSAPKPSDPAAAPSTVAPPAEAVRSEQPPPAAAPREEVERFPRAPVLPPVESMQPPARRTPLRDPSPAELKSLFSSDDGWEQPQPPPAPLAGADARRSAPPSPPAPPAPAAPSAPRQRETANLASRLDHEARARAQREAFRASRPPKPARPRAAAALIPAAPASGPTGAGSATPDTAQPEVSLAKRPEPPTAPDLPRVSPAAPAAPPAETPAALPAVPPAPAPEASTAALAHTDLSAMLPNEPPLSVSAAAASVAAPRFRSWRVSGRALAIASGAGLLLCALWLATRTPDPAPPPLLAGAATRAQPALALVRSRLQAVRDDAAHAARLEAAERARQAEAAAESRAPKKRRRTRRAARSRARALAAQQALAAQRASSDDRSISQQPRDTASAVAASQSTKPRAFDIKSANRALNAAAARARFCGQGSALQQTVMATVTFDPSGRTRVVRISRTRAGACVAAKLRGARVPSFQGNPVTVSRRVVVSGNGRASR